MFDESDDKPRRNLMAISLLFIVYALAGGDVTERGNFGIAYMQLKNPEVIEYIAVLLFIYFYWSYWVTHKGVLSAFLQQSINYVRASTEYRDEIIRLHMELEGNDDFRIAAIQEQKIKWVQSSALPLPEKDGVIEWKTETSGDFKVMINDTRQKVNIRLSTRINPDYYLSMLTSALITLSLTGTSFRDTLLPYAMAVTAIILTVAL